MATPAFRTKGGSVSAAGRQAAQRKGQTMPGGGFPIRNKADLENAKQSLGRAKKPAAAKRWINKRAKDLGEPPVGGNGNGSNSRNGNGNDTSRAASNNAIANRVTARLNARDR
jgi:hypothetical protein